jgi:L-cystine uptake protein TcyP (sodium:dicarboxylate symporter family)
MTDLKIVLLFFSYSIGPFLLYLMFNLFYFLLIIAITIAAFFFSYTSNNHQVFVVYLVGIILLSLLIRRTIFLKWDLGLNIHFIRFLARLEGSESQIEGAGSDSSRVHLPQNPGETLKKIKENLKKSNIHRLSFRLLTALAALHINGQELPKESSHPDSILRLKRYALRLTLMEVLAFLLLLIPFGLISFLFTIGVESAVKVLIYVLGFFFAWFLQSAIVLPISGLILQKRIEKIM